MQRIQPALSIISRKFSSERRKFFVTEAYHRALREASQSLDKCWYLEVYMDCEWVAFIQRAYDADILTPSHHVFYSILRYFDSDSLENP